MNISQKESLDLRLARKISEADRLNIWDSAERILNFESTGAKTAMGLGYVQSGKTTSMAALAALAADRGFEIVIAILGSTILLREQNRTRVEEYLGIGLSNYVWVPINANATNAAEMSKDISAWVDRGRVLFIPVLKHSKVIDKVASALSNSVGSSSRILIIDDEADQASLNTRVHKGEESATYAALRRLRLALPHHFYVQYTATPYAPLLLDPRDHLNPEKVEFLLPGHGYVGGKEFFISHKLKTIRTIPESDEQNSRGDLSELPGSLVEAVCCFLVGASILFEANQKNAPISMLIHSTGRNDVQSRYHFLLQRFLKSLSSTQEISQGPFASVFLAEFDRLIKNGAEVPAGFDFWESLATSVQEAQLWLINSTTTTKSVNWHLSPLHILIGGNKLDRGFTVEGLTVTYMNRPASEQIDTLEQRARAFGYRENLLPFCQFFATARTIKLLRGIVHTETDLRANLQDFLDRGLSISEWSSQKGMALPAGAKPTRASVIESYRSFNIRGEWQAHRMPLLDESTKRTNHNLLVELGIFTSDKFSFGRVAHRHKLSNITELTDLLDSWIFNEASPNWHFSDIREWLSRTDRHDSRVHILLLTSDEGHKPRIRKWSPDVGFINLFQGRDAKLGILNDAYPGDLNLSEFLGGDEGIQLQIHHVTRRGYDDENLYTLALKLGEIQLITRGK